jgi:hypothetical protein
LPVAGSLCPVASPPSSAGGLARNPGSDVTIVTCTRLPTAGAQRIERAIMRTIETTFRTRAKRPGRGAKSPQADRG